MLRRRLPTRSASLLALGLCVACGSAGNGDYIQLYPPDAGSSGAAGSGASGADGSGGSGNIDAGVGGVGGSAGSADGGVEPGLLCQVAFVDPAQGAGVVRLGKSDDQDGTPCGSAFETSVQVASNAASVALFVNGTTHSGLTRSVDGLTALFPSVQLSNTGDTPNELRAVATLPNGQTCEAVLDTALLVDCDMPSCTIVNPSGTEYLSLSEDSSSAGGFQVDLAVTTEVENAGQPVLLTLDGAYDQRLSGEVQAEAGDGVARFADVPLFEGRRLAQAECRDAAGNVAYSSLAEWIVDVTPCSVTLDLLPNPITTVHDLNGGAPGLLLELTGVVSGDDCAEVFVGPCGAESFSTTVFGGGGEFVGFATLPDADAEAVDFCARVRDLAGNIGDSAPQTKRVRVTPPAVAITSPGGPSLFNQATDLQPNSPSCEVDFTATCSDHDVAVQLREANTLGGQANTLLATANCDAGLATFNAVSLASRNTGNNTFIVARQVADGLTGDSEPLVIQPDCQAPQLSFAPAVHCGGQLSLTGHDVNGGVNGLQYNVTVFNDGVPGVELELTLGGGSPVAQVATNSTSSATFFNPVSFGSTETTAVLNACATDPQGNQGCVGPCTIEIVDMPVVTITSPTAGDTLTDADDCDTNTAGLQVTVQGTVDAVDGSAVDVSVGSSVTDDATTVSSGAFIACVDAAQDALGVTLQVSVVDDARPAFPAVASVVVNVDGNAPSATIAAPIAVLQERRPGIVRMSWQAVSDEGGGPLIAYQMRCGPEPIDASNWGSARPIAIPLTPKTSGTEQIDLDAFRVGTTVHCAVRGEDIAHNLTDLPATDASTAVTVPFETREYTTILDSDGAFMASVTPVGDVNGDGFADMVYGVEDVGAQIIFGGPSLDPTPGVTIQGLNGKFAAAVAGLGDIDGDGHADFAISAATLNGNRGSVFVFLGKDADDPWPSLITVAEVPCTGADLCIRGTELNAGLGWDMAATNYDGDGFPDLVLGARGAGGAGRVYVLRGGSQLAARSAPIDLPNAVPEDDLQGFVITAPQNTSDFGISVAAIGAGSDGRGDLVIGANGASGGDDGAVAFVAGQSYSGSGLVPLTSAVVFATGDTAEFGVPVRGLGDFDGDGAGDVAVSIFDGTGTCEVFTRSAGNLGFSGARETFTNAQGNLVFWSAYMGNGLHPTLGLVGDLDADDMGELLLGSFGPTASVELFYGDTGVVGRDREDADFGFVGGLGDLNPSFVGDLNGDGWNDVAILEFNPFEDAVTTKITLLY